MKWQYSGFYVVRVGDKVVGNFGYRDVLCSVYGRTQYVRFLMNAYVLEPYRIFGAGTILAKKIFNTSHSVFVSGYTDATKKLGKHLRRAWKDVGNFNRYIAVLDARAPFLRKHASAVQCARRAMEISHAVSGEEYDIRECRGRLSFGSLWKKSRKRYPVTAERTDAYLNWRFTNHPMLAYSVVTARKKDIHKGYLVYRYEEDQGFKIARVIDLIASEEGAEAPLLADFLQRAKKEGAHMADFLFSGNFHKKALKKTGFFLSKQTPFDALPTLYSPITYKKNFINMGHDLAVPFRDGYFTKADGDQDRPNPH
ncbi:MAG: hypothetical protein HYY92_03810 [Parcubacteria group bacterium]|nr:hypothetical protein [Parcubacteria group bacterium]